MKAITDKNIVEALTGLLEQIIKLPHDAYTVYELKRIIELIGKKQRFVFVRDDDTHWYAVPAELRGEFEAWVDFESAIRNSDENAPPEYNEPDFDEYRLNMHISNYSFTDMEEYE